jgi:glutamine amidotransferase
MKVVIIQYNAGNVQSVRFALRRAGIEPVLSQDHEEIKSADKVIFPGVGNAASAMEYLHERKLDSLIKSLKQPVLGICLGLQLLCDHSEEGNTTCMGIFKTGVNKFITQENLNKIPQVGWNNLYNLSSVLFNTLTDPYVYYVHSYYADISEDTIAITDYTKPYSAALQKDNFYAVQFHPEKSGDAGQTILSNFLRL